MAIDRRGVVLGALSGAFGLGAGPALASAAPRRLSMLNLHTGERMSAVYFEAGAYLPDALAAFDRVLRDHRSGQVHAMAPELLDLAAAVQAKTGVAGPIHIISGFRSPASNAKLHAASNGVAVKSLHMQGKALDIRLPGAQLANLRDAALALGKGGVGYYPGSQFVHVDIGRVRRWAG